MLYSEHQYLDALYGRTKDIPEGENKELYESNLIVEHNRQLLSSYPWLSEHLVWEDDGTFTIGENETFEHTWLDCMPDGWRLSFGLDLCYDLKQELKKFNYNNRYYISDIKEKYGVLRWYDGGYPEESEVEAIIDRYVRLSEQVCMDCGNPVEWKLDDPIWIYYYCDDCKNKLEELGTDLKFIRIEE